VIAPAALLLPHALEIAESVLLAPVIHPQMHEDWWQWRER
jgi:hypothetical protein